MKAKIYNVSKVLYSMNKLAILLMESSFICPAWDKDDCKKDLIIALHI